MNQKTLDKHLNEVTNLSQEIIKKLISKLNKRLELLNEISAFDAFSINEIKNLCSK